MVEKVGITDRSIRPVFEPNCQEHAFYLQALHMAHSAGIVLTDRQIQAYIVNRTKSTLSDQRLLYQFLDDHQREVFGEYFAHVFSSKMHEQ